MHERVLLEGLHVFLGIIAYLHMLKSEGVVALDTYPEPGIKDLNR